jgi:hypothetical protein
VAVGRGVSVGGLVEVGDGVAVEVTVAFATSVGRTVGVEVGVDGVGEGVVAPAACVSVAFTAVAVEDATGVVVSVGRGGEAVGSAWVTVGVGSGPFSLELVLSTATTPATTTTRATIAEPNTTHGGRPGPDGARCGRGSG